MELKEFITETLVQMTDGIVNAAEICKEKGAKVNPLLKITDGIIITAYGNSATMVKFHVGLCESSDTTENKGIGVFLAALKGGLSGTDKYRNETNTSIEFSIPIEFPHEVGNDGVVYSSDK